MSLFSKPVAYVFFTFVFIEGTNIFLNMKMVMKVYTLTTKLSVYYCIQFLAVRLCINFLSATIWYYSISLQYTNNHIVLVSMYLSHSPWIAISISQFLHLLHMVIHVHHLPCLPHDARCTPPLMPA